MDASAIIMRTAPVLAVAGGVTAGWVLFLHLMQSNQSFAETVGAISPSLANQFSCGCPLCSARAQCRGTMGELSMARLDGQGLNDLFRGLPAARD